MNPRTYETEAAAARACIKLAGPGSTTYPDGTVVESDDEGGWSFIPVPLGSSFAIERRDENGHEQGYHGID